jgi:hypothetical protein
METKSQNNEFNFIKLTLFYRKEIKRRFENGDNCGYLSPSVLITFMDILVGQVNKTMDKLMTFFVVREDVLEELNFLTGQKVSTKQYDALCEKLQKWGILSFKKGKNKMVKREFTLNLAHNFEGKKVPTEQGNDVFLPNSEHKVHTTISQELQENTTTETIIIKGLKDESIKGKSIKESPSSSAPQPKILEEEEASENKGLDNQQVTNDNPNAGIVDSETEIMVNFLLKFFNSIKPEDKIWLTNQVRSIEKQGFLDDFTKRTRAYIRIHTEFKEKFAKYKTSLRKYITDLWTSKDWVDYYQNLCDERRRQNADKVHYTN